MRVGVVVPTSSVFSNSPGCPATSILYNIDPWLTICAERRHTKKVRVQRESASKVIWCLSSHEKMRRSGGPTA